MCTARTRLVMSAVPPGGNGTMMRTDLEGNVCACATPISCAAAAIETASKIRVFIEWPRDVDTYGPCGFHPAGYIETSCCFSSSVSGKIRGSAERNSPGLHGQGRPHISFAGSLLCPRPIAWPSSCLITLLATFRSVTAAYTTPLSPTAGFELARQG